MPMVVASLTTVAAVIWWGIVLSPWRPWSTRERLDVPADDIENAQFADITVLIPARDEAAMLPRTLRALAAQGAKLRVVVVDDQSADGSAQIAAGAGADVIAGAPLAPGWTGKLWALEQGRRRTHTPWLLLLDADIELKPGTLAALQTRALHDDRQLVSVMARLRMCSFWERALMPAFVYFFKLLYPFALANSAGRWIAAAAGGCVLVDARALAQMGGFGVIRDALIDDCALARAFKSRGFRSWIGLSDAVISRRPYPSLAAIWQMVARTAFTQLHYSVALLALCSVLLCVACWMPVLGWFVAGSRWIALAACIAMALTYLPTLRFYRLSPLWCLAMPLIGTLFLIMTWHSAWRYGRGIRGRWKGRDYERQQRNMQG